MPPDGSHLKVAAEYWERLSARDPLQLVAITQFQPAPENGLVFRFLNRDVLVDPKARCLRLWCGAGWDDADDPLLELATVLYLINVKDVYPLGRDIVGPKDLKEGHFFQGPHELKIAPLVERFGTDVPGLRRAAEALVRRTGRHGRRRLPAQTVSAGSSLLSALGRGRGVPAAHVGPFRALNRRDACGGRHLGPGQSGVDGAC